MTKNMLSRDTEEGSTPSSTSAHRAGTGAEPRSGVQACRWRSGARSVRLQCRRRAREGRENMTTKMLEYRDGALTCRGYLAYDDQRARPRPGVVLFPQAFGIGEPVRDLAARLAALGYVARAAAPYGNGATGGEMPQGREV